MGREGSGVDTSASQICKTHVVQNLRRIGVQDNQNEQHNRKRNQEAKQAAKNGGQRSHGKQRERCQNQSHESAQFNGYKPIIDGSFFHCEQHDIADENEPTVLKVDHVQNCVCNYDPDEEHQPEIEQEFLFDLFSHFHFLQSGSGGQFSV